MPHPPLDAQKIAQALQAYQAPREQAVRYVLSVLDPMAFDAPARPYLDVLARVHELITAEMGRAAGGEKPQDTGELTPPQEEQPHG